ncbi:MAG TPA: hypothetical protein VFG11_07360, partial [Acidobacteriota bacterium]|nr:hypothetical protein [Acidobacteriota bacterium]
MVTQTIEFAGTQKVIAVVAALQRELMCVSHLPGKNVALLATGIGSQNADRAITAFLRDHSASAVINVGFACALCPELQIGDVVLATEIRGKTTLSPPSSLSALTQDLAFPWLKNGIVASSPIVLTKAREKQRLAEVLQADQPVCADMESWSIANFCSENRIPFLVARAIT